MVLSPRARRLAVTGLWTAMWTGGCAPAVPVATDSGSPGGFRPLPADARYLETENNDTWSQAEAVLAADRFEIVGDIGVGLPLDRDIFQIGPAAAGDRIRIELDTAHGLDVVVGLLDSAQQLLAYTDPWSITSGPAYVDLVIREDVTELYLVVATRSVAARARAYTVGVEITRGTGVLGYRPQVIVLSFAGAEDVQIGTREPVDVPPFDAAAIDERFAGQTEPIIALILERVRDHFAGLDIEIYRDGDAGIPTQNRSVVHFGTYDARLLGLAESIDPFNANPEQDAILFTDTFAIFSALLPTTEQIAQVLANVASHEIGHLLGLRHTADPDDLMDVTATASRMLRNQWFLLADLHESVLPAGLQDAPTLLAWTLGGSLLPPPLLTTKDVARNRSAAELAVPYDFHVPRHLLSTCGCTHACDR